MSYFSEGSIHSLGSLLYYAQYNNDTLPTNICFERISTHPSNIGKPNNIWDYIGYIKKVYRTIPIAGSTKTKSGIVFYDPINDREVKVDKQDRLMSNTFEDTSAPFHFKVVRCMGAKLENASARRPLPPGPPPSNAIKIPRKSRNARKNRKANKSRKSRRY